MLSRLRPSILMLVTATALTGFGARADAATLRSDVTVSGNAITLGDLFDDAGAATRIIVADAPAPGLTTDISVSRISLAARRNGLAWHNTTGLTHVTVARAGTAVPDSEVSAAIASAIIATTPALMPSAKLQVDFANGASGVQVGLGDATTVKVEQIATNPRTGAFEAMLRAPADDLTAPLRRVSGRAYPVVDVPVLTREIAPGDVVRAQDIDWVRLPAMRVSQNIVTSQSQLVGMSPRHQIRPGDPIRTSDVQAPLVVTKGTQVDMTYTIGSLTLMARGRALQSGAVGDTVDVLNPRSSRTIQAVVEGPSIVRVESLGAPRLEELKS